MKYHQGRFTPRYPEKYVGEVANIIYRSSWELRLMIYLDTQPSVLKWASEEQAITYISPIDNKPHRYFIDFFIQYKASNGEIKKAAIEVKPHSQTKMPKPPQRQTKKYLNEVKTYAVNESKWASARAWCEKNGFEFWIFDEYTLGIKKR